MHHKLFLVVLGDWAVTGIWYLCTVLRSHINQIGVRGGKSMCFALKPQGHAGKKHNAAQPLATDFHASDILLAVWQTHLNNSTNWKKTAHKYPASYITNALVDFIKSRQIVGVALSWKKKRFSFTGCVLDNWRIVTNSVHAIVIHNFTSQIKCSKEACENISMCYV